MGLKKLGSTGRFGARYGRKIKKKLLDVEKKLKSKQKCPYCKKKGVKRISYGIWYCKKCNTKYAGRAYSASIKIKRKGTGEMNSS